MQAAILMAGLEGVKSKRSPGKRYDIDMFTEGQNIKGVDKLPLNLLDAIRLTDKDKIVRQGLGNSFVNSYTKLKMQEWLDYAKHLSQWERENTLDC